MVAPSTDTYSTLWRRRVGKTAQLQQLRTTQAIRREFRAMDQNGDHWVSRREVIDWAAAKAAKQAAAEQRGGRRHAAQLPSLQREDVRAPTGHLLGGE